MSHPHQRLRRIMGVTFGTAALVAIVVGPASAQLLTFPAVQTCLKGVNNWIAVPTKADPNPDEPAPQIGVGVKLSAPD